MVCKFWTWHESTGPDVQDEHCGNGHGIGDVVKGIGIEERRGQERS